MSRVSLLAPLLVLPCALSLGCSSQADPDYQGEPLATVHGTVETSSVEAPGELDAAIVWASWDGQTYTPDPADWQGYPTARVRVEGTFPSAFTLEILQPPPMDTEAAYGLIAAVPSSAGDHVTELSGVSLDAWVAYFSRDGDPNDPDDVVMVGSQAYNVPPTKGFHLIRTVVTEEAEAAFFRCQYRFLCQRTVGLAPAVQPYSDEEFELCTKYVPDAPTCTYYQYEYYDFDAAEHHINEPLSVEEEAESTRCFDLMTEAGEKWNALPLEEQLCPTAWSHPPSEGFDHPVTVKLGATFSDFMQPRASDF